MIENSVSVVATFVLYLIMMLIIGYYAYKKTSSSSDYFLGGRNLGPWPTALSAGASDMSGWLLLGLPGYAYVAGIEAFWLAIGLLLGTWANWFISAKRLRTYSVVTGALTIPEFLARRFDDNSKLIQTISAFFILLFFLFYTSSGLVAGGKLFETVFGLDYSYAVVIGAICVISYTLFGGFLAVSWTDFIQGLLMAAALLVVPIAAMQGGLGQLNDDLMAINPELMTLWNDSKGEPLTAVAIISLLAWGLGYFGQPHILARFKAIRSNRELSTARRIAVTWSTLSMLGAMLVGLVGLVYVSNSPIGELADGERIFMLLVDAVFHPVIAGILLAAILAAIMSTADSQLLVSSSALAEDFYKQLFNTDASSEKIVKVGRISVILIAILALVLAMSPDSSVLGLVSYAWAGFGAAFGPTIVLSLYWSRMNRNGALAGIIVGGVTIVIWKQLSSDWFSWFDVYEIVPGIIFSTLAIVIVSLVSEEPKENVLEQYKEYQNSLRELD